MHPGYHTIYITIPYNENNKSGFVICITLAKECFDEQMINEFYKQLNEVVILGQELDYSNNKIKDIIEGIYPYMIERTLEDMKRLKAERLVKKMVNL